MHFEIPLADGSTVYMRGEKCNVYAVVLVSMKKFWGIWYAPDRDLRSVENWYTDKYVNTDTCFKQSREYPVVLPQVGDLFAYDTKTLTLKMTDGATRIQWLYDHGATYFPVFSSLSGAPMLRVLAGQQSS